MIEFLKILKSKFLDYFLLENNELKAQLTALVTDVRRLEENVKRLNKQFLKQKKQTEYKK